MSRIRLIGLALVAVFAISAVSAASASAAPPEFGKCVEKAGSGTKYEDSNCTKVNTKGKFEFIPLAAGSKIAFTSKSGEGFLEASGEKITCKEDETKEGEITGPKEDKVKAVVFKGCTALGGLAKCQNTATKGEIQTEPLVSTLGFLNAGKTEVGLSLAPASGGLFAKFECEALGVKETVEVGKGTLGLGDSVIGKITPVNEMTTTFTLSLKCVSGKQEFKEFSGGNSDLTRIQKRWGRMGGSLREHNRYNHIY